MIDGLVCDMDGVLYRGDRVIERAPEAVDALRNAGIRLCFCTNNSHFTPGQYRDKLSGLGIRASEEEILTSGIVTAEELDRRGLGGRRAIVIGGDGVRDALSRIGTEIDDDPEARTADLVVVGWDPSFDYASLRRASAAVRHGAEFVATNQDPTFPASDGLWPGAGAILAAIERASDRTAVVMGKPHEPMMQAAARRLAGVRRIAIVGDRPDTDLAGGTAMGWTTVLVLTGVTRPEDVPAVSPTPDLVIDSIADLRSVLTHAR